MILELSSKSADDLLAKLTDYDESWNWVGLGWTSKGCELSLQISDVMTGVTMMLRASGLFTICVDSTLPLPEGL